VLGHQGGESGLIRFARFVCMGEGRWLTGHGDSGLISSRPNLWRMLCSSWQVADASLLVECPFEGEDAVWLIGRWVFDHIIQGHWC